MFRNFWKNEIVKLENCFGNKKIYLGLGVFDGVHLGHQSIISSLKEMSNNNGIIVAVTFSPHPRTLLNDGNKVELLISLEQRIELLKSYGVNEVIVVNFDKEFANLTAREFLDIIYEECNGRLSGISVGKKWRFGAMGRGDNQILTEFSKEKNINFCGVDEIELFDEVVSSSNIRKLLKLGELEKVNQLLGRSYRVKGIVEKGYKNASTKLDKPTANLKLECEILMPDGVYAAVSYINSNRYKSAVNIGVAPSFNYLQEKRRLEVHLLDFDGIIYGEELELEIIKFLRPERKFENIEELKKQIHTDIASIHKLIL